MFQLKIDRFSTLQQWPLCLGFLMELTDNFDWHDNAQTLHNETDAWAHAGSKYETNSQGQCIMFAAILLSFFALLLRIVSV